MQEEFDSWSDESSSNKSSNESSDESPDMQAVEIDDALLDDINRLEEGILQANKKKLEALEANKKS